MVHMRPAAARLLPVLRDAEPGGSSTFAGPTGRSSVGATNVMRVFMDTGCRRAELLGLGRRRHSTPAGSP
jgi:hypothetical protein